MALATGTNCLTKGEDALRTMLANTSQFQAFVAAGDAAEALESIYTNEVPLPGDADSDEWSPSDWLALFPCAIISPPADGEWLTFDQFASDNQLQLMVTQLGYGLRMEAFVDASVDEQKQIRQFLNKAGDVLEALASRAGLHDGEFGFTSLGNVQLYKYDFARRHNMGHVIGLTMDLRREVDQP